MMMISFKIGPLGLNIGKKMRAKMHPFFSFIYSFNGRICLSFEIRIALHFSSTDDGFVFLAKDACLIPARII